MLDSRSEAGQRLHLFSLSGKYLFVIRSFDVENGARIDSKPVCRTVLECKSHSFRFPVRQPEAAGPNRVMILTKELTWFLVIIYVPEKWLPRPKSGIFGSHLAGAAQ
jgi:hypothetical protein